MCVCEPANVCSSFYLTLLYTVADISLADYGRKGMLQKK
jgi:hypothetical protein